MSFFSLTAWLLLVLFSAFALQGMIGRSQVTFTPRMRDTCGGLFALAAFLFMPPGSLPPFIDTAWGGAAFLLLLALAALCLGKKKLLWPICIYAVSYAALCWYAWQRGVPGSLGNLGVFVAMPVWATASPVNAMAFFCLGAGHFFALRLAVTQKNARMGEILFFPASVAFFVTLYLPWNTAPFVPWPLKLIAGADSILFWVKICIVAFCAIRVRFFPSAHSLVILYCVFSCIIGAVLLFFSI